MLRVLLICTGNTCRSPMAEAILRDLASPTMAVSSAGTATEGGQPMAAAAQTVLKEHGLPVRPHRSQAVSEGLLQESDVVLTMTAGQAQDLMRRFPGASGKVRTLAAAAGETGDVVDPVGMGHDAYATAYDQIETLLRRFVEHERGNSERAVVAFGSDHAGFHLKRQLMPILKDLPFEFVDCGTDSDASTDYPDFARTVAEGVSRGDYRFGVLICGTGVGMSIAANKVDGVRAANCQDPVAASLARQHNDANIITLGERLVGIALAEGIVRSFLTEQFQGGRHQRRIAKIEAMEHGHRE